MPSTTTFKCPECGKEFASRANMRRHVQNMHDVQKRAQCPYCTKTRTRADDLVRHHIVNNHPERLVEVQRDRSLIKMVPWVAEPPTKKLKPDVATSRSSDSVEKPQKNETVTDKSEKIADKQTSSKPNTTVSEKVPTLAEVAESPSFIRRMAHIIEGAAEGRPAPTKLEGAAEGRPAPTELERAVTSILPHEDETPTMYIPSCDSVATQISPVKLAEPTPNLPCASGIAKPVVNVDANYVETHCPHGSKRPIHVHIWRKILKPSGEIQKIHEIHVNCAKCPQPTVRKSKVRKTSEKTAEKVLRPQSGASSSRLSAIQLSSSSSSPSSSSDSDSD